MEFVELVLSPTKRYIYKNASNIEMNILGDFLVSDVGYRSTSFKNWTFDPTSQHADGNLTSLKKENNYIVLSDIFTEKDTPSSLKMTCEQYVKILNDWETQVCKLQPKEIIIKYENNEFIIESIILNKSDSEIIPQTQTNPHSNYIAPHLYPLWIKFGFTICCALFLICLFDFPYYFKLHEKIQKAYRTFKEQNYSVASIYFEKLSRKLPNSKCIKRYLAQSLFKSDKIDDHMIALDYLADVRFDKYEWQELLNYMPLEYTTYFQDVKKDRT